MNINRRIGGATLTDIEHWVSCLQAHRDLCLRNISSDSWINVEVRVNCLV